MLSRARLGRSGEAFAARYLRRRGLRVIERNFRCRLGEIDIVARDGDQLVFVEVRSARSTFAGRPELTVDERKQARLARAGRLYLAQCGWRPAGVRFDVIGLTRQSWWRWDARWYRDAFGV